jgi:uncharacterized protein (DUF2252 family)
VHLTLRNTSNSSWCSSKDQVQVHNLSEKHVDPAQRKSALLQRQQLKMASSANAYVRGNTVRFYEWLRSDAVTASLPVGPKIWICGDCHVGNLGPVADTEGKIEILIRDLDQTVVGNPAHDLLRLGLSLAMAARSSDLPGVTTAFMLEEMVTGYLTGLSGRTASDKLTEAESVQRVLREAERRTWRHLVEERIEDVSPKIPLGRRFWPMTSEERGELESVFKDGTEKFARCINGEEAEGKVRLLDAAYWMKGCSSLGRLRYAILIGVGKKKAQELRLLDMKEATEAAAPCAKGAEMPSDNAERVVAGACHLSPYLGERMIPGSFAGQRVVTRELRPQDLKFELTQLSREEAIATARMLAGVVGRAHGRQMSRSDRTVWMKELKARHGRSLDAPRWLWSGVVDLVGLHEAAYLEHCRKYATKLVA